MPQNKKMTYQEWKKLERKKRIKKYGFIASIFIFIVLIGFLLSFNSNKSKSVSYEEQVKEELLHTPEPVPEPSHDFVPGSASYNATNYLHEWHRTIGVMLPIMLIAGVLLVMLSTFKRAYDI